MMSQRWPLMRRVMTASSPAARVNVELGKGDAGEEGNVALPAWLAVSVVRLSASRSGSSPMQVSGDFVVHDVSGRMGQVGQCRCRASSAATGQGRRCRG